MAPTARLAYATTFRGDNLLQLASPWLVCIDAINLFFFDLNISSKRINKFLVPVKEHAEDVFLVLRGVHIAAQIITGAEEEAGELAEGELGHISTYIFD